MKVLPRCRKSQFVEERERMACPVIVEGVPRFESPESIDRKSTIVLLYPRMHTIPLENELCHGSIHYIYIYIHVMVSFEQDYLLRGVGLVMIQGL